MPELGSINFAQAWARLARPAAVTGNAQCNCWDRPRQSEKKLMFVAWFWAGTSRTSRCTLYVSRVGCSGPWLHNKRIKHRTQACLPVQAVGSVAHTLHVASPHTPGLGMPSQLRFLWSCWSPSEDWWQLSENHLNTLRLDYLDVSCHFVIDSPGIEAMTTCEKAGQWFPALGILMTPQARLQRMGMSNDEVMTA